MEQMYNFKAVITTNPDLKVGKNQAKHVITAPINLTIVIDKNNSIKNIQPRIFNDINLFSIYYGRPSSFIEDILYDIEYLIKNNY